MVNFTRTRLQVFISSTFTDLIDDRQAAVEAILTAGHIPAGMELFTAGDESQMDVIKQWINESDAYLLILGGRYGSIEPTTGKSYTQLEYEYAVKKEKPLFSCVIEEAAIDERVKEHVRKVTENENPKELRTFRELVCSKMVKFWNDEKDIKLAVMETLSEFSRRDDLVGWVRADQASTPELASEIARLSKENADLRTSLAAISVTPISVQLKKLSSTLRTAWKAFHQEDFHHAESLLEAIQDASQQFGMLSPDIDLACESTQQEVMQAFASVIPFRSFYAEDAFNPSSDFGPLREAALTIVDLLQRLSGEHEQVES